MWFSSHRLNNFKAYVYGTKMLIYLSTKWLTMYFYSRKSGWKGCLFSLNFQTSVKVNEDKRHVLNYNQYVLFVQFSAVSEIASSESN